MLPADKLANLEQQLIHQATKAFHSAPTPNQVKDVRASYDVKMKKIYIRLYKRATDMTHHLKHGTSPNMQSACTGPS